MPPNRTRPPNTNKQLSNRQSLVSNVAPKPATDMRIFSTKTRAAAPTRTALLVGGGWPGHQPWECLALFAASLEQRGYRIIRSDSLDVYTDRSLLSQVQVAVQSWTMGEITRQQADGLVRAVEGGMGLAGWHGGLGDAFRNSTRYQFLIGGQFVAHPGGIRRYEIHIEKTDDPITRGISDFSIRSEQYYMHVDPGVDVLATTVFTGKPYPWIAGCRMPVAWKRTWGKGRVFYCSVGHNLADFKRCDPLRRIVLRGILWAAGDLPPTPSGENH